MGARRAPVLQAREELRDPPRRRDLPPRAAGAAHRDLIGNVLYAVAALLLVGGGALKLVDPAGSVGALRALGLPAGPAGVRVASAFELGLGGVALTVASAVVAALVAASYAAFLVVTVVALGRRLPIDSCGCLGGFETPPSWRHVVVVGLALGGSISVAVDPGSAPLTRALDDGWAGVGFAVAVLLATAVAVAMVRAGRRPSTV